MPPRAAFLLLMLIMVGGCKDTTVDNRSSRGVIDIEDDDAEMVAAIATAKRTLWFFEKNWQTMDSEIQSLKFALPTSSGELEHIWFSPTAIFFAETCGDDDAPRRACGSTGAHVLLKRFALCQND